MKKKINNTTRKRLKEKNTIRERNRKQTKNEGEEKRLENESWVGGEV